MGRVGRRGSGSGRQKKMPGLDNSVKRDVSVHVSEGIYILSAFAKESPSFWYPAGNLRLVVPSTRGCRLASTAGIWRTAKLEAIFRYKQNSLYRFWVVCFSPVV